MGLDGVLSPIELSRTFGFNRITGIRHSFDNAYKTIEGIVNKKLKKSMQENYQYLFQKTLT
ncbi:hypothetical protein [Acidiplasma cupricumulans]|uniref:hypothetical protein n=1 Tax=Acidiplasma cupricumulans TaxID=312540 RepID=UPI00158514D1|nr:hypothetical protein [Acidiplasma cupricumulans]